MEIKLINKRTQQELLEEWGNISRVCYDTPEDRNMNVARHCYKNNHMSGSRAIYFVFNIKNVSRATVDQLVRHEQGVVKNVKSQRFCSEANFDFYTSPLIEGNDTINEIYKKHMKYTQLVYSTIQKELLRVGETEESANENARGVLPMNIYSEVTIAFTIEALTNIMHKRLCLRSQEEIRQLALAIKREMKIHYPIVAENLVSQCQYLLYCPENNTKCPCFTIGKKDLKKLISKNISDKQNSK